MINVITANVLKTRGVSALKDAASNDGEAFISVRGKNEYVVLLLAKYNYLRECELDTALAEAKADVKAGRYLKESVDKHTKRITNYFKIGEFWS